MIAHGVGRYVQLLGDFGCGQPTQDSSKKLLVETKTLRVRCRRSLLTFWLVRRALLLVRRGAARRDLLLLLLYGT